MYINGKLETIDQNKPIPKYSISIDKLEWTLKR